MNFDFYHEKFRQGASILESPEFERKKLRVAVVDILSSVALKLYKDTWANEGSDPLTAPSRIFFSIWVNEKTLKNNTLHYNIHALKLRHLTGYAIESAKFAASFRKKFRRFKSDWPNVKTDFGPLTLMEGWHSLNNTTVEDVVTTLASKFVGIDYLIDDTLAEFKRRK